MRSVLIGWIRFIVLFVLLVRGRYGRTLGEDNSDITAVCRDGMDFQPFRLTASNREKVIHYQTPGSEYHYLSTKCIWVIQTEIACGYAIEIQFGAGDVKDVEVLDGPSATSDIILSSAGRPLKMTTSGQFAFIYFFKFYGNANLYIRYRMVKKHGNGGQPQRWTKRPHHIYNDLCFDNWTPLLVATTGKSYVSPTGFSTQRSYPRNKQCSWMITADNACDDVIKITITNATLDSQDLLQIYDGPTSDDVLLASVTGSSLPPIILSSGPKVFVTFTSGNGKKEEGSGFEFSYESTSEEHSMNCINVYDATSGAGASYPSGAPGYAAGDYGESD